MATFDVESTLSEIETISEQVRTATSATSDVRNFAKALAKFATLISDNADSIVEVTGDDTNEVYATANRVGVWADLYAPKIGVVTWKSDELTAKITALTALGTLGAMTSDQLARFSAATAVLSASKTRKGRGESQAQIITGRPEFVQVFDGDTKVSQMSGNKVASPGNLARRLASLVGIDTKSDDYDGLLDAANAVCSDGVTVEVSGLSLVPVFADSDEE